MKRLEVDQGPAMGAALLAGVGAGAWPGIASATAKMLKVHDEIKPVNEDVKAYREAYRRYRALYPSLAPYFHEAEKS